jgi:bidirectional [NiFe] hydrogenase diaphorase subunit
MTHVSFAYRNPRLQVDASHDRFIADPNRCILCTRCVRACDELEGVHTWDVEGRGVHSLLVTDLADPWGAAASCTSCGKCVQVCPTGALSLKGLSVGEMRRRGGLAAELKRIRGARA